MKNRILFIATLCLTSHIVTTYALPANYTVVAPQCLTKNLSGVNHTLASTSKFSLLQVNRQGLNQLIAAKHQGENACGGFFNVTADWHEQTAPKVFLEKFIAPPVATNSHKAAYAINYSDQVKQLMGQLNPDNMWASLTTLTNFHDRYSNSDNGVAASNWLKDQVDAMVKSSGRNDVSIRFIPTRSIIAGRAGSFNTSATYKQSSLVVKIGNSNASGIVIGAHMDTLNGQMPGADDDGSGTVTVLELAKILINSNMQFKKPIYLIWYSAEEEGLIGSGYTEKYFKSLQMGVDAVIQFDMTGFSYQNDPTIWLMKDYTDPELTAFLETLINTYVKRPVKYTACGYACSDHATWTQQGYKAAIAYEGEMKPPGHPVPGQIIKDNTYIHTTMDTMEKLSLTHMTDYAKLGIAFAVELAGPIA
ncbi:MAG: M20/M25/M40 family metallo-hydrolase [Pseudomonadota bacterium]